jgi:hypothetical protein
MHVLAMTLNTGGGSYISNPPMFLGGLALAGIILYRLFRGR